MAGSGGVGWGGRIELRYGVGWGGQLMKLESNDVAKARAFEGGICHSEQY